MPRYPVMRGENYIAAFHIQIYSSRPAVLSLPPCHTTLRLSAGYYVLLVLLPSRSSTTIAIYIGC